MLLLELILLASGLNATVYGFGEMNCGDPGKARPCEKGAVTASGEVFDPDLPSAALPSPFSLRVPAMWIGLRVSGGECQRIRLNDKSNERWIGVRGFDLSPGAVKALVGEKPTRLWSATVEVCSLIKKARLDQEK